MRGWAASFVVFSLLGGCSLSRGVIGGGFDAAVDAPVDAPRPVDTGPTSDADVGVADGGNDGGADANLDAGSAVSGTVTAAGVVTIGGSLTTTLGGTWSPAPTYQWQRGDAIDGVGAYHDIAGASSATYVPVAADIGYSIRCVATNGAGSSPSNALIWAGVLPLMPSQYLHDAGQTATGGHIDAWADSSHGVGDYTATGNGRPSNAQMINGVHVATFDGARTSMQSTSTLANAATSTQLHLFLVLRANTASAPYVAATYYNSNIVWGDLGGEVAVGVGDMGGTRVAFFGTYHTVGTSLASPITLGSATLVEGRMNGAEIGLRVGAGAEMTGTMVPGFGATTQFLVLGHNAPGAYFDGDLAALVTFNAQQPPAVRADLRAYLANRYGVAG